MWVLLTLLPTLLLNAKQKDQELSTRDYAGWTLWVIGFVFEALSDYQKSAFRADPENAVSKFQSPLIVALIWGWNSPSKCVWWKCMTCVH